MKKTMDNKYGTGFLAVILMILTIAGCDFLEENPVSTITSDNYYQSEEDAVAATNALYDYLSVGTAGIFDPTFGGIFFNDYWVFHDLVSDNVTEKLTGQEYRNLSLFNHTADNVRIEYYWQDLYKTINAANTVVDKIPPIDFDNMRKQHLISEARFIRAMMYFELARTFGDVPLIIQATADVSTSYQPRTSKEAVYAQVISDLEFAEQNLSDSYRVGKGRPTPMAATALLSKVYLYMENYEMAAEKAQEVIESNEYFLWDDFADIFKIENMNEGEIIFAVNFSGTQSEGFKPNQYLVRLLPSGLDQDGEGPENAQGWEVPTDDLYNSFYNLDRRKEVTFIESFTYSDGSTVQFEPHFGKFWDQEAEPRANNTDMDVIYLRYADVLLIYAEALNEVNNGPTPQAYDAINQVRRRARFDGTTERNVLPDIAGLNYQQFKDAILKERRWEFVLEGQRWGDLVRMDKLVDIVNASGKENASPEPFHKLFPIPQRELNINKNLTQNPGY
ncbi:RagB/SusD family nutrient uptake outer membrane protein [Rhodohalobacter sp. 614A]|uniref:RagB/SusD family nutrient uptake outer membrane protein n=1 Tax=Rhodohalobacter sp. 614A TaxID=2908649 RepID=UPI001F1D4A0B|nr:RagB/SusD family nutrient uptake outer membrane protein [Rhodohalobacter sp. 614A]